MAKRTWSARARRDFREREDYRKRNDEKDRYEKRDSDRRDYRRDDEDRERDARRDRREERGFYDDYTREDYEADLIALRDSAPDSDSGEILDRLRARYDWYEQELDKYDADYDDLMKRWDRLSRRDQDNVLRETSKVKDAQMEDIKNDNKLKTFDEMWKEREG